MDTFRYFIFIEFLLKKKKKNNQNQIFKGLLVTSLILDIEPIDSQVQITAGTLNGSEE